MLGPSASGKTYSREHHWSKEPAGSLLLDGEYIRRACTCWADAQQLARQRGYVGFNDYFKDYFKAGMDKVGSTAVPWPVCRMPTAAEPPCSMQVKKAITDKAVAQGANIVIPETASDSAKAMSNTHALPYACTAASAYPYAHANNRASGKEHDQSAPGK